MFRSLIQFWWKAYSSSEDGVILAITIPKGTPIAYIDARIQNHRGVFEVILPRGLKLKAIAASGGTPRSWSSATSPIKKRDPNKVLHVYADPSQFEQKRD